MAHIINADLTQKVIETADRLSSLSASDASRLFFVGTGTEAMRANLGVELSQWGEEIGVFFPGLDWGIYKESSQKNLDAKGLLLYDRHKVIQTYVDLLNDAIDFIQRNTDNIAIVPSTLDVKVRALRFGVALEEYVAEFRNRIYSHTVATQQELFVVPSDSNFQTDPVEKGWNFVRACSQCNVNYNEWLDFKTFLVRVRVIYNSAYSNPARGQLAKSQTNVYQPFEWASETARVLKTVI